MSIKKSSIIVTLITAVGMVFTVAKQVVIAKYFGTSSELDSFFVAAAVPSVLGGISIGFFSSSMIPILTPLKEQSDKISEAITSIVFFTLLVGTIVAIFGFSFKELPIMWLTAYSGEKLTYTANLAGYLWIITGIAIFTYMLTAIFNLYKHFVFPGIVNLFIPFGITIAVLLSGKRIGTESIVIGWLFASGVMVLFLISIFKKIKINFRGLRLNNSYTKEIFFASIPIVLGGMPFTILPTIDAFWTSRLAEGSMSYIGYCTQFTIAIDTLVKNGIYTVLLPFLAENVNSDEEEIFWRRIILTIKYIYAILIPVTIYCIFFKYDIIRIIFERGAFSSQSTKYVSSLLPYYLIGGLLAMVPVTILNRAYYAKKQYIPFAIIGIVLIAFYFVLAGILSYLYGVYGIGIAYIAYWTSFLFICSKYIQVPLMNKGLFAMILKLLLASAISVLIVHIALSGVNFLIRGTVGITIFVPFAYLLKIHKDIEIERLLKIK